MLTVIHAFNTSAPLALMLMVLLLAPIKANLDRLRESRARRSLAEFVKLSWHVLEPTTRLDWNWHHDAVCAHLQAQIEGWVKAKRDPSYKQAFRDLLVNVPPGTLKSRIIMVCAPAWAWLLDPSARFLCGSGNPDIVTRDSVYCRRLILSNWYQRTFRPSWKLADDQDEKLLYHNTAGGFRSAQGMTSAWVGDRGDFVFLDDPNDSTKVQQEAHRRQINEIIWDTAASGRVNDARISCRTIIMQRLHERDLTGHVLSKRVVVDGVAIQWLHLVIPMFYEVARRAGTDCEKAGCNCVNETTVIGWRDPRTADGENVHPLRFTDEAVAKMREDLGSYGFAGQCQQRPAPAGGGMFKRAHWRFFTLEPTTVAGRRPSGCDDSPPVTLPEGAMDFAIISLDANFKKRQKGNGKMPDWAAFGVLARVGSRMFVREVRRCRGMVETKKTLRDLANEYPEAQRKLIEDAANGTAILEECAAEVSGMEGVTPKGGSEARAWAMQPSQQAGNWHLLDGAPWLEDWVGEFDAFPNGVFADQVDMASQAWTHSAPTGDADRLAAMLGMSPG